jgi:mRNA-degrading endonuclease toxin of MazEF toxin-antitoxin module
VPHQAKGFDTGAFDAQGIGSIPTVKLVRHVGTADVATLQGVEGAVKTWLALS